MLARAYPIFADYYTYQKQPAFWIETLHNIADAEAQYAKAHASKS